MHQRHCLVFCLGALGEPVRGHWPRLRVHLDPCGLDLPQAQRRHAARRSAGPGAGPAGRL